MKVTSGCFVVFLLLLLRLTNANAATLTFNDETTFLAAAAGLSLESFEAEVATNSRSLSSLPLADFTMTMSAGHRMGVFDLPNFVGGHPTDGDQWVGFSDGHDFVEYSFNSPVSAFGINIVDFGDFGNGSIEFTNDAGDAFTAAISGMADGNDQFFGVISDMQFTTATMSQDIAGEFYGVDEIYYGIPVSPITLADLDIKPGSDPNSVNLKSRGVLPVAILTTGDFDALQVDLASIVFGDPVLLDGGAIGVSPLRSSEEDVNGDGLNDLTLKFSMRELVDNGALGGMSMEAILSGLTFDGMMFEGSDSVRIVPPGDANNDGLVDAADYTVWANGFGGASPQLTDGDFNGDGSVDGADYTVLANNFGLGASAPAGAVAAVPEPSTFALILCGVLGLFGCGWRRRRRA